jgi:hypothetical protein
MPRIPTYNNRRVLPTEETGQAKIPYSIADTGAGAIGAGLQNLAAGLENTAQVLDKLQLGEDMLQASSIERQIQENWAKTEIEMANEPDNDKRAAIFQNSQKFNASLLSQAGNQRTAEKLTKNYNQLAPQMQSQYLKIESQVRKNNILDKSKYEMEQALASGNRDLYNDNVDNLTNILAISQEKASQLKAEYPVNSTLMKAKRMAVTDPVGAQAEVDSLDTKGLTKDQLALREDVLRDINFNKTVLKHDLDVAIEAQRQEIDDIFIKPQDEFLASVPDALDKINKSQILPVKDKEEQRKKINDRVQSIKDGKVDPVDKFDPEAYNDLSIRISKNSKSVSQTEISNAVGLGEKGGITVAQKEVLFNLKKKYDSGDVLGKESHRLYSSAINKLRAAKAFSGNKVDNANFATKSQSLLDKWAIDNPEATFEDYEAFYNRLIDTSGYSAGWDRFWFGLSAGGKKAAIRENVTKLREELNVSDSETDLTKLSDAELIKNIKGE